MTDGDILDLEAWLAEHVMRFTHSANPDGYTKGADQQWYVDLQSRPPRVLVSCAYRMRYAPPNLPFAHQWRVFAPTMYSPDMCAVLEICLSCAEIDMRRENNGLCRVRTKKVTLVRPSLGGTACQEVDISADADTMPLAVCLFARRLFETLLNQPNPTP